jgi:hypothetical protein
MESPYHPGCWDRGSDHNEEHKRKEKKERDFNPKGKEKDPVGEHDPYPDNKREKDISQEVSEGMEEFQSFYEFFEELKNPG